MRAIFALLLICATLLLISISIEQFSKKAIQSLQQIGQSLETLGNYTSLFWTTFSLPVNPLHIGHQTANQEELYFRYTKKFFTLLTVVIRELPQDTALHIYAEYLQLLQNMTGPFPYYFDGAVSHN